MTTLALTRPSVDTDLATYRPKAKAALQVLPFNSKGRKPGFIVGGVVEGDFLHINQIGTLVIPLLDGSHTVEQIIQRLRSEHKVGLTAEQLHQFLDRFAKHALLEVGSWRNCVEVDASTSGKQFKRGLTRYWRLFEAERPLRWMLRHRRLWFNPLTIALSALLSVIGIVFALFNLHNLGITGVARALLDQPALLLVMLVLLFTEIALHELAHSLASGLQGLKPGGFGVGLLWRVVPVFFTDTRNSYMLDNKYRRSAIFLAGPIVDLMALGVAAIVAWLTPADSAAHLVATVYVGLPLWGLLVNLNPFLFRMDGYWIASALMEQPNLRQTALVVWVRLLLRLVGRKPRSASSVSSYSKAWKIGLALYGIVAIIWTVLFVLFFMHTVVNDLLVFMRQVNAR